MEPPRGSHGARPDIEKSLPTFPISKSRPILLGKSLTRCLGRERIPTRRIHEYLSGLEAGRKLEKQADIVGQQLDAVRAAMKILGREVASSSKRIGRKKRVMSAAARAKIGKATKERWAKFRAEKKKGKH